VKSVVLLSMHDLTDWSNRAARSPMPGGALPYGLQYLRQQFSLKWSDSQRRGIWRSHPARAVGGMVRRGAPGVQGSLAACYAAPKLRAVDVALSIFENVGLGFARMQDLAPYRRTAIPHVMLTCWLAENCQHMSTSQRRSVCRSMRSISSVAVFSANQVPILQEYLRLEPERVRVVPFGVDTEYYSPSAACGPLGGGGLVAVGGDVRRDYATLIQAIRIADVHLTLVCYPRNIRGLELPSNVTPLSGISHEEYRRLLLSADLVVTPTVAPAYPCGQSVVLEAMSMGKATLTTDSPAIRDYLTDDVNGVTVPPHDPLQMAKLIDSLLGDGKRRQSLGDAAAKAVRERFSLEHMWNGVAGLLASALH
jgi:glycosyltransferase involved in cell wall biosynthesis